MVITGEFLRNGLPTCGKGGPGSNPRNNLETLSLRNLYLTYVHVYLVSSENAVNLLIRQLTVVIQQGVNSTLN